MRGGIGWWNLSQPLWGGWSGPRFGAGGVHASLAREEEAVAMSRVTTFGGREM